MGEDFKSEIRNNSKITLILDRKKNKRKGFYYIYIVNVIEGKR